MKWLIVIIYCFLFFNCFSIENSEFILEQNYVDSLTTEVLNETACFQDSLVRYIEKVTDELKPYAAPDFNFTLIQNDTVIIILFKDNKYMKPLLVKRFDAGHYRIYMQWHLLTIDNPFQYSILKIIGNDYSYEKMLLLK